MNNKIRELAEQAGFYTVSETFADEIHEAMLSRFAELIIVECASICMSSVGSRSDYSFGRLHCASEIIDTFELNRRKFLYE